MKREIGKVTKLVSVQQLVVQQLVVQRLVENKQIRFEHLIGIEKVKGAGYGKRYVSYGDRFHLCSSHPGIHREAPPPDDRRSRVCWDRMWCCKDFASWTADSPTCSIGIRTAEDLGDTFKLEVRRFRELNRGVIVSYRRSRYRSQQFAREAIALPFLFRSSVFSFNEQ